MKFLKLIIFAGLVSNLSMYGAAAAAAGHEGAIPPITAAGAGSEDVEFKRAKTFDSEATDAMWEALRKDKVDELETILKSGKADPNKRNSRSFSPLAEALSSPKAFILLLEYGADPALPIRDIGEFPWTPLQELAYGNLPLGPREKFDMANALLDHNPDLIDIRDSEGNTPLMIATKNNNYVVVGALLKRGADMNAKNKKGNDVFYFARDPNMLKLLTDYKHRAK